jgi:glycosyltransferase involved in cell wall biosynthesis
MATSSAPVPSRPLKVAFLFTTFPKTSETFLQRDVTALIEHGVDVRLYSLFGGGGEFCGRPVRRFNLWKLVPLFLFIIPWNCLRRPRIVRDLFEGVIMRAPPAWLNFWENMLGAGFAGCFYREFRRDPPDLVHGAWAGAPATAGWLLWRILGLPFSCGAHAYDLYEHGGDWWLLEKLRLARFVQTSTESGRQFLIERGIAPEKIFTIRRGFAEFPAFKNLRVPRRPLRLLCIARLVEKKGLRRQLRLYAALHEAGFPFEARLVGTGPMRAELIELAATLGLDRHVTFVGELPHAKVWAELAWADALLHTGIVAASGDRDGLPNVIPEAMAAGVLVVSSPVSATTEAVQHERTGLVADVDQPLAWRAALDRLAADDALAETLRRNARAWVEENYDARKNTARLIERFEAAARS